MKWKSNCKDHVDQYIHWQCRVLDARAGRPGATLPSNSWHMSGCNGRVQYQHASDGNSEPTQRNTYVGMVYFMRFNFLLFRLYKKKTLRNQEMLNEHICFLGCHCLAANLRKPNQPKMKKKLHFNAAKLKWLTEPKGPDTTPITEWFRCRSTWNTSKYSNLNTASQYCFTP